MKSSVYLIPFAVNGPFTVNLFITYPLGTCENFVPYKIGSVKRRVVMMIKVNHRATLDTPWIGLGMEQEFFDSKYRQKSRVTFKQNASLFASFLIKIVL